MRKKRLTKKQRLIRAYIARAIAILIALVMLVLMFCGCLYIRDLFTKDKDNSKENQKVQQDEDSQAVNGDNAQAELPNTTDETDATDETSKYAAFSVVLDAGHGGYDGGTLNGDILEKNINLSITLEAASLLKAEGITVTLTRETDEFISLEKRVSIANQTNANLFVSLHCNYFEGDDSVDGLEVFYVEQSEGSQKYGESIANAVKANPNIIVRGATENNYYVTRNSSMDAVLIEMGFLSNPAECQKLTSSDYQKQLAQAIVDGILSQFDAQMGGTSTNGTIAEDNTI